MVTPLRNPEFVYKVATRDAWAVMADTGRFPGMPVDIDDGYVHFSTAAQLGETLRLHFAGQSGLVVFAVRTHDLGMGLRWEPSRRGQLFPHLYGELHIGAVAHHGLLDVAADGSVALPEWVQ